jgi:hypothetical protein
MFSDVAIGAGDLARAVAFRDTALAPLGIGRASSKYETRAAWWRPGEAATLWAGRPRDGLPPGRGDGWMAAFAAPSRAAVDAADAAGLAAGGSTRARTAPPASPRCGWRRSPRSPQRTGIAAGRCLRASNKREEPMRGPHVATGRRTAAADPLAERGARGVRGRLGRGLAGAAVFGMGPGNVSHRTATRAPRVAA